MNMRANWKVACVVASVAVSAGCVPNKAYRLKNPVTQEKLKTIEFDPRQTQAGVPDFEWPYRLSFIEFDDRGEMFDRNELNQALGAIYTARKEAAAARRQTRSDEPHAIVAVFIHGWKNNASDSSGNVWGFRQVLAGLSYHYKVSGGPFAPVVGVYIGWRGAVLSPPLIKEFSFWDRRDKSQNLPGAHMVEALLQVMRAAKGTNFDDNATISILIGHSFGGAVLETALTQTLEGLVVKQSEPGKPAAASSIPWPANRIVFINEAQEATRSYQLIESLMTNVEPRKSFDEPPAVISMSSTGDYATRAFFPFGQAVSRPFNSLRRYAGENALGIKSQTPMYFNTTAHMEKFQSHLFGRADDPAIVTALRCCRPYMQTQIGGATYIIVEKPGALNRTPYWVMELPPSLVPDHSTIFTPAFRNVLLDFLFSPAELENAQKILRK